MKKTILILSAILISVLFFNCKSEYKKHEELIGKWQSAKSDTINYVLDLGEDYSWKYFKEEELLEKGTYDVEENIFIMKHAIEEHDHAEEGDHHHAHPEDHKYEFSLNDDKTELSLTSEGKTSLFKRIK